MLAEVHLGLVHVIAYQTRRRVSARLDVDDLRQVGAIGLIEASRRFDVSLGIPFPAYARQRIEGAMLDYLRSLDLVSRQHRREITAGAQPVSQTSLDDAFDYPTNDEGADMLAAEMQRAELVRDAILTLDPRLAQVIVEHYFDGRPYRAIARSLSSRWPGRGHASGRKHRLSTSRVGQLHTDALAALRDALATKGLTAESLYN